MELLQRPLWKAEPPQDPMRVLRAGEMAGLGALVRRCADLADLAGDTMASLAAEAAASAQRVRVLAHRCGKLEAQARAVSKDGCEGGREGLCGRKGVVWHGPSTQRSGHDFNLFGTESLPVYVRLAYEDCQPPPPLGQLDQFVGGGGSCSKYYSDPEHTMEAFASVELEKAEARRAARKERRRLRRLDLKQREPKAAAGAEDAAAKKAKQAPKVLRRSTIRYSFRSSDVMGNAAVRGASPSQSSMGSRGEASPFASTTDMGGTESFPAGGSSPLTPTSTYQGPPPPIPAHLQTPPLMQGSMPDFSPRLKAGRSAFELATSEGARGESGAQPRKPAASPSANSVFLFPPTHRLSTVAQRARLEGGGGVETSGPVGRSPGVPPPLPAHLMPARTPSAMAYNESGGRTFTPPLQPRPESSPQADASGWRPPVRAVSPPPFALPTPQSAGYALNGHAANGHAANGHAANAHDSSSYSTPQLQPPQGYQNLSPGIPGVSRPEMAATGPVAEYRTDSGTAASPSTPTLGMPMGVPPAPQQMPQMHLPTLVNGDGPPPVPPAAPPAPPAAPPPPPPAASQGTPPPGSPPPPPLPTKTALKPVPEAPTRTPAAPNLFSEGDFALQLQAQRSKLQEIDETEVLESRPVDSRSELMDNIKSQNFKLRRLSINPFDRKAILAKQAEAGSGGLNNSAAAILEKAKQRRLALEGDSDESDVSDDDDDW